MKAKNELVLPSFGSFKGFGLLFFHFARVVTWIIIVQVVVFFFLIRQNTVPSRLNFHAVAFFPKLITNKHVSVHINVV